MMPKSNSPQPFEPRKVGRYLLHREIAHGGMATVHIGRLLGQVGFSRTVAIKRMHEHCARDPDFVSMFIDEARLAARVRHPNVVPTLDVVVLEGELFLVMEYVQGETLARLIRRSVKTNQRAAPRVVSSVVAGLLEGLHAAHEAVGEHGEPLGIVHRDVSPQNVMVGNDGVARVLDFGVAKASNRLQTTRDGQIKGKIEYMAPEQIRGSLVDRRTDVYSAACCLWEMLTGRRLYIADNSVALWGKVLEGNPDPPSSLNPDVSRDLDEITMRGLAADPTKRYQTAEAMAIALEQAVGIATPREVGRWVQALAGKKLRERAELVAELDSVATDFPLSQEDEIASCVSSVSARLSGAGPQAPGSKPPEVSRPPRSSGIALASVPGPKPSPAGGVPASGPVFPVPQQIEPPKPAPAPLKSPRPEPPKPPRPAVPKPDAPPVPKPDAPPVPKPDAPPVPKPDAPQVPKPDAPQVPKPDAPPVPKPDAPPVPKPDVPVVPPPDVPVVPAEFAPLVPTSMADDTDVALPVRRSPVALIGGLVVVLLLLGGGLLYGLSGSDDTPVEPLPVPTTTASTVPRPVEAPTATATASVKPAEPKKVRLRLAVSPATAKVSIDGVEHKQREVALDMSNTAVKVVVEAPGYVTMDRPFVPESDGELVFELKRVMSAPKPTATVEIRGPVETEL